MKKLTSIILCLVLLLSFCGCMNVNKANIDVTETEISDTLLLNKISNQINYKYLNSVFTGTDATEQYEKAVVSENESEIKSYLIESKIIIEKCKDLDILITVEDAKKALETEYNQIKEDEYYNIISSVLQENSITEAEYLNLRQTEAYYKYNKNSLKNHFSKNNFDSSKSSSLDEQFKEYISKLK